MNGLWTYCVMHDGANDAYTMNCPAPYNSQYVFDISFNDTRSCTECTCDAPQGGACSSLVTIYTDNMCTMQLASDTVTEAAPVCVTLSPGGPPLGSKNASTPVFTPGMCQPDGGVPTGNVQQNGPITFCCLN
jgi:hypothetical protein